MYGFNNFSIRWVVFCFPNPAAVFIYRVEQGLVRNFVEATKPLLLCCVRRQGFWHQELRKLRECPAHLVGFIMRRAVCDASVALRVSFV
jgi:hypothetical protein